MSFPVPPISLPCPAPDILSPSEPPSILSIAAASEQTVVSLPPLAVYAVIPSQTRDDVVSLAPQ
jgi:hypothetical protein